MTIPEILLRPIVAMAIQEDFGRAGDVTASLLRQSETMRAAFRPRTDGVISGVTVAPLVMGMIDPSVQVELRCADGDFLPGGTIAASVEGSAASIVAAERVCLNFLTMMSGVASLTRQFVRAAEGTGARIAATRKTLPGLRVLQKAAVMHGGGLPHRYGLDDAVLIKDNHIAACGGVAEALRRAQDIAGHMRVIEVEVDSLAQLEEAIPFRPHAILLDNFAITDLRQAVAMAKGVSILEASGGVALNTVRAIAETGVDVISVGALTHSAPALDIGLDAS